MSELLNMDDILDIEFLNAAESDAEKEFLDEFGIDITEPKVEGEEDFYDDSVTTEFDDQMSKVLERFPTIHVSTITLLFNSNLKSIDLDLLKSYLASTKHVYDEKKSFGNCVIVKVSKDDGILFEVKNNISISFFKNGSINIAGPTTMKEANEVGRFVCELLTSSFKAIDANDQKVVEITKKTIEMINTNCKLEDGMVRCDVANDLLWNKKRILGKVDRGSLSFRLPTGLPTPGQPLTHPSLQNHVGVQASISLRQHASIRIFTRGNVVVSGVVIPRQLGRAYSFLRTFLRTHQSTIFFSEEETRDFEADKKEKKKRGRKRKADFDEMMAKV